MDITKYEDLLIKKGIMQATEAKSIMSDAIRMMEIQRLAKLDKAKFFASINALIEWEAEKGEWKVELTDLYYKHCFSREYTIDHLKQELEDKDYTVTIIQPTRSKTFRIFAEWK